MDLAAALAGLVFLVVVTLIVGLWWFAATSRRIQHRLGARDQFTPEADTEILRADPRQLDTKWVALVGPLATLVERAGYDTGRLSRVLLFMGTFAVVGGGAGWL
ncbi:MAG: hypothetical protein V3T97_00160, partial [Gemmatimonadota bacterium]